MDTGCTLPFGDGEYHFWLGLEQAIELERLAETPVAELEVQLRMATRITPEGAFEYIGGGPGANIVRHIIRLGLIGGNNGIVDGDEAEVGPARAKALIAAYVWPARPMAEAIAVAATIVFAAVWGIDLKKKQQLDDAEAEEARSSSTREPSSTTAESSDSTGEEQA